MEAGGVTISRDEVTYFLSVAAIGGTLLGLAFIIGVFFLVDLAKRYRHVALPVYRDREIGSAERKSRESNPPHSLDKLTDFELLDRDPLVVFCANSVGVTWILFLIPLIIGLSAAWGGARLVVLASVLAVEICLLVVTLTLTFWERNAKIDELKPYLTREERLWPILGGVVLLLYVAVAGTILIAAFAMWWPFFGRLAIWNHCGVSNEYLVLVLLKGICVFSLALATYTTNKDMYIFFKNIGLERARQRWLNMFVEEGYPILKNAVDDVKAHLEVEARETDPLLKLWNKGCPPDLTSTHNVWRKADRNAVRKLWDDAINRRCLTPSWVLDVPCIAKWAASIDQHLSTRVSAAKIDNSAGPIR